METEVGVVETVLLVTGEWEPVEAFEIVDDLPVLGGRGATWIDSYESVVVASLASIVALRWSEDA